MSRSSRASLDNSQLPDSIGEQKQAIKEEGSVFGNHDFQTRFRGATVASDAVTESLQKLWKFLFENEMTEKSKIISDHLKALQIEKNDQAVIEWINKHTTDIDTFNAALLQIDTAARRQTIHQALASESKRGKEWTNLVTQRMFAATKPLQPIFAKHEAMQHFDPYIFSTICKVWIDIVPVPDASDQNNPALAQLDSIYNMLTNYVHLLDAVMQSNDEAISQNAKNLETRILQMRSTDEMKDIQNELKEQISQLTDRLGAYTQGLTQDITLLLSHKENKEDKQSTMAKLSETLKKHIREKGGAPTADMKKSTLEEDLKKTLQKFKKDVLKELQSVMTAELDKPRAGKAVQEQCEHIALSLDTWLTKNASSVKTKLFESNVYKNMHKKIVAEKEKANPDWLKLLMYLKLEYAVPTAYEHFAQTLSRPGFGQKKELAFMWELASFNPNDNLESFASRMRNLVTFTKTRMLGDSEPLPSAKKPGGT